MLVVGGTAIAGLAWYMLKPDQAKAAIHRAEADYEKAKAEGKKLAKDAASDAKAEYNKVTHNLGKQADKVRPPFSIGWVGLTM